MPSQYTCPVCGSPFSRSLSQIKLARNPVCSRNCAVLQLKSQVGITCAQCDTVFMVNRARASRTRYCSLPCRHLGIRRPRPLLAVNTDGETALVPLHRRDGAICDNALIDAIDIERISQHRWHVNRGYAVATINQKAIRMHRLLIGPLQGDALEIDHINRDKLDNRRANLRSVTRDGNKQNVPGRGGSSQYRGVSRHKEGKWQAGVQVDGKLQYLGLFEDELEAAEAAREARARLMPFAVD